MAGAHRISAVLSPFKMMTIARSCVGTLSDLRELLAVVQTGNGPPIRIETRRGEEVSAAMSDLKIGGGSVINKATSPRNARQGD